MSGLITVGYFLFSLSISLLLFILWIRIALRYFHISVVHPVSQTIIQLTNPILTPINRLCSSLSIRVKRYDWPCLMLILMVEIIKFIILGLVFLKAMIPWSGIIILSLAELIYEPCNLLFYALILRVILSWVGAAQPLAYLVFALTEPLLAPIRQRLPNTGGLDFSPLVAIILLKVITIFISTSLPLV